MKIVKCDMCKTEYDNNSSDFIQGYTFGIPCSDAEGFDVKDAVYPDLCNACADKIYKMLGSIIRQSKPIAKKLGLTD